jgi:hypothetical protein
MNVATVANGATPVVTFQGSGFFIASSNDNISGHLHLVRRTGSNSWAASGSVRRSTATPAAGVNISAGVIALAGELDIVQIIRSGSSNYNGGVFAIGYR